VGPTAQKGSLNKVKHHCETQGKTSTVKNGGLNQTTKKYPLKDSAMQKITFIPLSNLFIT